MPRATLKKRLEERLGKPLRSIILEHVPLGTGRYEAARILEAECNKHRKEDEEKIKVLHSTLWYTIKKSIENGELCEVHGDAQSPPIFYFNHDKKKHVTKKKDEVDDKQVNCSWSCTQCGHEWNSTKNVESFDLMAVRSQSCPECNKKKINTFGKIVLDFDHGGVHARKAVILINGKPRESFVDNDMNPVESPFERQAVSP